MWSISDKGSAIRISAFTSTILNFHFWGEVKLSPLGTSATGGPIVAAPVD
jgi:hypothetical protein